MMPLFHSSCIALAATLCVTAAAIADNSVLLTPSADAPAYQLSNLRIEDDRFGRTAMVFDYTRTKEGKGRVQLAGRSPEGPLQISFSPNVNQASGEVRLTKMFSNRGGAYNYEFYFVSPAQWAGKYYGNCLISNTVRMGNPGGGVSARQWNAEERAAYEKQQLADTPPKSIPAGLAVVTSGENLVPGMPLMAGRYGDWVEAEYLAPAPDNQVSIRYRDDKTATTLKRDNWLAVDPKVLEQAQDNPSKYRVSMRVLPGGSHPLPRDGFAIDDDLELPRGTPLLRWRGFKWSEVFVTEDLGSQLRVRYPEHPGDVDWPHDRSDLAIRQSTLDTLAGPNAAKAFADNVLDDEEFAEDEITVGGDDDAEGFGHGGGESYDIIDRSYPIEISIPRRAQKVPSDLEIPEGTPVAYCWGREWEPANVIADRGRVLIIREEDEITSFVYRIKREQVIIKDVTVRKLRAAAGVSGKELQQTLRTWTDSSGSHKVEARFVRVKEGKVTLKTDAGREIQLPVERLSEADQELLKSIKEEVANPFE